LLLTITLVYHCEQFIVANDSPLRKVVFYGPSHTRMQ